VSETPARPLRSASDADARALTVFLATLVGRERGGLLEVRGRRAQGGMAQRFDRAGALRQAADKLLAHGAHTDVYVGCAPRRRPAGDRTAVARVWTLWVDCDDAAAVTRLAAFAPALAIVVSSGIIRSGRVQRGCGRADRCRRHVVSEAELDAAG
jgi:hypothetical protein